MNTIHERINERFAKKDFDKAMLKGKDLTLYKNVIKFLDRNDLHYDLVGSVKSGIENGVRAHYKDIDILVRGVNSPVYGFDRNNSLINLMVAHHTKGTEGKALPFDVKDWSCKSARGMLYCDTNIEYRFDIGNPESIFRPSIIKYGPNGPEKKPARLYAFGPNAKVDLCYERMPFRFD